MRRWRRRDGRRGWRRRRAHQGRHAQVRVQRAPVDSRQRPQLNSRFIGRQLTDALTEQDPETGEILPWLATSWEVSDDVTRFTFHLRDDVTFSDGEPFDAEAVRANFDAITELSVQAQLESTPSRISGEAGPRS
ncbi:hypothetical protein E1265_01045 [Streptomyces sp. 8K308]|nr:hypothetical protein E1265_01045 [Streptomyces sp. 8K308]